MPAPAALLPRRAWTLLALGLLASLLIGLAAAWPRVLPELPPALREAGPRLPCLSYAPFRRPGASPLRPGPDVSRAQLREDLQRLAAVTGCVRSYAVDRGLEQLPGVAAELGLTVKLGVWIGRDEAANARQLDTALALAARHPGTVTLLVVGNEVLLRGEQSPEGLAAWLARARAASPVPVAYAEVWSLWQRHGALLAPQVDTVAVHVLPYWEDHPLGVDAGLEEVFAVAATARARFPGRAVLIGETGWPAEGRARGAARAGRVEQAAFLRGLLARLAETPLDLNVIEADDQPWKRALEGAAGGAWGVFDAEGRLRSPWQGPVAPARAPARPLLAALGLALLGAMLARRGGRAWGAMLGALLGAGLAWQFEQAPRWGREPLDAALALAAGGAGLLLGAVACRPPPGGEAGAAPSTTGLRAGLGRAEARVGAIRAGLDQPGSGGTLAEAARLVLLLALASGLLLLLIDGRYRGAPWAAAWAPAWLALATAGGALRVPADPAGRLLARGLGLLTPVWLAVLAGEGSLDREALLHGAALLALAWAWGRPGCPAASSRSQAPSAAGPG